MSAFNFATLYQQARTEENAQLLIDALPYAQQLGMRATKSDTGWLFSLAPKASNIGNPTLPAIHGGAVAGFMGMSAVIHLLMEFDQARANGESPKIPKVVDFSVDFVRACRYEDTYASCEVVRQGRKMANVGVRVWQKDTAELMATARAHYLLS